MPDRTNFLNSKPILPLFVTLPPRKLVVVSSAGYKPAPTEGKNHYHHPSFQRRLESRTLLRHRLLKKDFFAAHGVLPRKDSKPPLIRKRTLPEAWLMRILRRAQDERGLGGGFAVFATFFEPVTLSVAKGLFASGLRFPSYKKILRLRPQNDSRDGCVLVGSAY
jgi:hypothetical protein